MVEDVLSELVVRSNADMITFVINSANWDSLTREDRQDISQEALLALYHVEQSMDIDPDRLSDGLRVRIIQNCMADYHRSNRRHTDGAVSYSEVDDHVDEPYERWETVN